MKMPEVLEKLETLKRAMGSSAMGYRLKRDLIHIIKQYQKDWSLREASKQTGTETGRGVVRESATRQASSAVHNLPPNCS